MFTPAELIEAMRRRLRRSIRPSPAGAFPPGWQAWFEALRAQPASHGTSGARAAALVEMLAQRSPLPRPPAEKLGGWGALRALWRQQWEPPRRDERGLRVFSRTLSLALHLSLVVVLSLLMHARFMLPAPDAQRGEHVIEVEFIGSGTPEEEGGGQPAQATTTETVEESEVRAIAQPDQSPLPRLPEPDPAPAPQPPQAEEAPTAVAGIEPVPEPPAEVPPPADQPLVLTETPLPDGAFQLPPLPPVDAAPVRPRAIEVAPRTRDIELAETRDLAAPPARVPAVPGPELPVAGIDVVEREITLPTRPAPAPVVPAPAIPAPALRPRDQQARVRDVPMPPVDAVADAPSAAAAADQPQAAQPGDPAQAPAPRADRDPSPGTGPVQAQREGAWATPRRGADPGASARETPGGQEGSARLFNPDGSVRLPPGTGQVGGGLPPGTITEDYEKIDRMGTWLRRPPTDYEPTSFDRVWVPHENLLQEWVRRSVRTVLIPIPGTSKSIRCDVALLAVAGGCIIVDPNLQDQPAGARPPPDVPFRPELHEDQQGLSDDPGS